MGRLWPEEWNRLVMDTLRRQEATLGRRLNVAEITRIVQQLMRKRNIPIRFLPYRG